MCSWLIVVIATVTCLLISPIACLPLHDDVADDGGERRELLNTWLEPPGVMTNPDPKGFAESATSLLLDKTRDSGSMLDLLLALHDAKSRDPREPGHQGEAGAVLRKRGQSKVDDYGHGMFWGKRGDWLQHGEAKTGRADQQTKRGHDEYGFGMFFGKRDDADYDDFTL